MDIKREEIFSVSEISRLIKNVIDTNLPILWVEGEIGNYVSHSSGHIYFSLKDDNSTIRCAFFRQNNQMLSFKPKNGDKVLCLGKVDVYEKTGTYQVIVRSMQPAGIGELQIRFLELKKKLDAEGLFSPQYKKPLPRYPEKIGVITSPTGAAFQDIKNVITRRYPHHLFLYPASVQGDNAPKELIAGLEYFNKEKAVDIIIIGRGGGSQEDLFCFNDEALARAIFASKTVVISAVGHEIDFTISDFVADLRAPTPSAAAELAVPNKTELLEKIESYQKSLLARTERHLLFYKNRISRCETSLYEWHPRNILFKDQQRLDETVNAFLEQIREMSRYRQDLTNLADKFVYLTSKRASEMIHGNLMTLESLKNRLLNSVGKSLDTNKNRLHSYTGELNSLSPQQAMKRGYSILRKERKIVNSVSKIHKDDLLELLLLDGNCTCKVEKVSEKETG